MVESFSRISLNFLIARLPRSSGRNSSLRICPLWVFSPATPSVCFDSVSESRLTIRSSLKHSVCWCSYGNRINQFDSLEFYSFFVVVRNDRITISSPRQHPLLPQATLNKIRTQPEVHMVAIVQHRGSHLVTILVVDTRHKDMRTHLGDRDVGGRNERTRGFDSGEQNVAFLVQHFGLCRVGIDLQA